MSGHTAANVREKFSLEFSNADSEVVALKSLFRKAEVLPQLALFDSVETTVVAVSSTEKSSVTLVTESSIEDLCKLFAAA